MSIIIICAVGTNWVTGKAGKLPWGKTISADMEHFRKKTLGKTIVMGRKTWESIGGKALPRRNNIVMTREKNFTASEAHIASNTRAILEIAKEQDVFVIGGSEIYAELLPYATQMFITIVEGVFEGDTFFPEYDQHGWEEVRVKTIRRGPTTPYVLRIVEYIRISPPA
ncbi:hypothetical protein AUJ77_02430 [Candidatus Nomurabacteria bacterium CG1_02_43_90]|uniref:Dihydrofolate reductase n=1 Tax=Candidatus Nomurabacteria bacterium CG1_02_43_90 TaxID=1805281 RepID=A0A1J4V3U4_9BACT|nr:MAG: hypothetical protein AUJ77_02430 [Candidatus Nomurabacteria bacterium CG1_02_43_90]